MTTSSDAARQVMSNVQWIRLVHSLFQDMLSLALKVYIIVLVRQREYVWFASVALACFSVSINVTLIFGEQQPSTLYSQRWHTNVWVLWLQQPSTTLYYQGVLYLLAARHRQGLGIHVDAEHMHCSRSFHSA
jgi:hypothetical protein